MPKETLAVIGSIHGNEPLGNKVCEYIAGSIEGVETIPGHPDALRARKRYLGSKGELGGQIPGNPDSNDPEERQAFKLHSRLKEIDPWMAIDIHEAKHATHDFIAVAGEVAVSCLAIAEVLNIKKVLAFPSYPLLVYHPEVVEVEQVVDEGV